MIVLEKQRKNNIVLDVVTRAVLDGFCVPQEAQKGLEWEAGERNLVFYTNGSRITGRDHKWVLDVLKVTISMLHRVGLGTNLKKIKSMVCKPSFIRGKWGEKDHKRRATGERAMCR